MEEIKMSTDTFIKLAKELLRSIDEKYTQSWKPKLLDDSEQNTCNTCNGFLYICQGGVGDVDCPSCNGTGQNMESVFDDESFLEFIEHTVMFGKEPFYELIHCEIDNTVEGIQIPDTSDYDGKDDPLPW